MKLSTCPQEKKKINRTRGAAEAQLRSIQRMREGYEGKVYPCPYCRGWHVGRLKANAHQNKY
jgi:hypothetical protein